MGFLLGIHGTYVDISWDLPWDLDINKLGFHRLSYGIDWDSLGIFMGKLMGLIGIFFAIWDFMGKGMTWNYPLASGNQTWLAGKSSISIEYRGFSRIFPH